MTSETVTAEPYFPPMGYLSIKPMSPAILRAAGNSTVGTWLEGVVYIGAYKPPSLLIREIESVTG